MSALLSLTLFGQEVEAVKVLRRLLVLSAKLYLKRHMVIAPRPSNVPLLTYTTPEGELFTGYRYTAPELNILSWEYELALNPRIIISDQICPGGNCLFKGSQLVFHIYKRLKFQTFRPYYLRLNIGRILANLVLWDLKSGFVHVIYFAANGPFDLKTNPIRSRGRGSSMVEQWIKNPLVLSSILGQSMLEKTKFEIHNPQIKYSLRDWNYRSRHPVVYAGMLEVFLDFFKLNYMPQNY